MSAIITSTNEDKRKPQKRRRTLEELENDSAYDILYDMSQYKMDTITNFYEFDMQEVHDKMCYLQQLLKITQRHVVAYASDNIQGHPHHVYAFMRDRNGELARMVHGALLRAIADP